MICAIGYMNNIILAFSLTICVTSSISAMIVALLALAKVIGMEKSTHKMEYVPVDPSQALDFAKQLQEQIKEENRDVEL